MTHNDNRRPFCNWNASMFDIFRPWKKTCVVAVGHHYTVQFCQLLCRFKSIHFQIKDWISIISFLYPFQPGLFMNFFPLVLLWCTLILAIDCIKVFKVHKKGSILTYFFSPFIILLCIVMFHWINSQSSFDKVDRRGHWVEQLLYHKRCWLIVQVHVHTQKNPTYLESYRIL